MTHKALEEYFHKIVDKTSNAEVTIGYEPSWILVPCNQPPMKKEMTMFERSKAYWQSVKESWTNLYAWEHPKTEVSTEEEEYGESSDYYIFEMYTATWYDNETEKQVAAKRSLVIGDHVDDEDPSWTSVLDKILDEMSKHYGYDLKSQVYYAVEFPTNDIYPERAGRMLNDSVLQQLLLAFPEVYERHPKWNQPKNVFE